ncbi:MAG TPA: CPBP family intramembrane glutamic endopeptidase [Chitinophagaceae bacterium]|nr:CPBP family intramembrane glutamic endopeptidase [Chitinophagaceae bacterium]
MYDIDSRPGTSYGQGLLILLGSVFIGGSLGALLSAGIWSMMTGQSVKIMTSQLGNPAYTNAFRVLQVVSSFSLFFVPSVIMAYVLSKKPYKFLGFNFYFSPRQVLMTILIMIASIPLVGALGELNKMIPVTQGWEIYFKKLEAEYAEQVKAMAKINTFSDYLMALLIMAGSAAVFEEIFFRGALQNLLQRISKNPWISIGVSSVIFSAIHFSFYGFLPRLALGIVLGLFFYYSGSLWLCILAHVVQNAMVVTQVYVYQKQGKSIEDAMNETLPLWWGLVGFIAVVLLFMYFRKNAAEDRKTRVPAETVALEDKWMT